MHEGKGGLPQLLQDSNQLDGDTVLCHESRHRETQAWLQALLGCFVSATAPSAKALLIGLGLQLDPGSVDGI